MRDRLQAARLLFVDLASTLAFPVAYLVTHDLSVALGLALGVVQIAIRLPRRQPIDVMQWLSVVLVIGAGAATLMTDDPRFGLFKPSVVYGVARPRSTSRVRDTARARHRPLHARAAARITAGRAPRLMRRR